MQGSPPGKAERYVLQRRKHGTVVKGLVRQREQRDEREPGQDQQRYEALGRDDEKRWSKWCPSVLRRCGGRGESVQTEAPVLEWLGDGSGTNDLHEGNSRRERIPVSMSISTELNSSLHSSPSLVLHLSLTLSLSACLTSFFFIVFFVSLSLCL